MLTALSDSALMASASISLDPAAVPFLKVLSAILIFVLYDLLLIVCREMFLVLVYLIALQSVLPISPIVLLLLWEGSRSCPLLTCLSVGLAEELLKIHSCWTFLLPRTSSHVSRNISLMCYMYHCVSMFVSSFSSGLVRVESVGQAEVNSFVLRHSRCTMFSYLLCC